MGPGQNADAVISMVIEAGLAGTDNIQNEANALFQGVEKNFRRFNAVVNGAFVGVSAAAAGVGVAALAGVTSLMGFEDAFAGVRKTVDADEETLQRLSQSIRDLATELPVAATELARIGELGGQLGIEAANIETFTETVTKLSVATVLSTENAALALARLAAIASIPDSGLDDFFERTGASIVELGNNFAATEDEIITTVLRIATAAEQSGASTQDALAFATALQAIGVPAQAGGTAIARVFQEIQRAIQTGGEQLELFATISNTSAEQFQKDFQEDAALAVVTFIEGLSTAEDRVNGLQNVLQKLNLSQRRTQLAVNGLATAQGLLRDALVTSRSAYEANVALNVEAAKKFATTKQQLILLKNQFQEAAMQLGEGLLPMVRNLIFGLQGFAKGLIETNFGLDHFIQLFKSLFKILFGSKIVSMMGLLIIEFLRWKKTLEGVAVSTAILNGVTGNLFSTMAGVAAGVAFLAFLSKINKEFKEIASSGASVAFSDTLQNIDEFAGGANKSLADLKNTSQILKDEFLDISGIAFESLLSDSDKIDAESIKSSLNAAGIKVDDSEISKILNAALYIQTVDENVENLGNSLEFVFEQAVENITGAGGAVGDFFTTINDLRSTLPEAEEFMRSVFQDGMDPRTAAIPLLEVLEAQSKELNKQAEEFEMVTHYQQDEVKRQQAIQAEIVRIAVLKQRILDLSDEESELGKGIALNEREKLEAIAEQMLIHEGEKNILDTQIKKRADILARERERGRIDLSRRGYAEEEIRNLETSASIKAFQNKLTEEGNQLASDQLQKEFDIITQQMTISANIESIAQKSARSIVSLFNNIPEQIKMSASEMTRNLQDQAIISAEFIATIQALQAQGFQALAATLAQEGPAALTAAKDFLNAPELAQEAESNLRVMREDLLKELAGIPDEIEMSGDELRDKFEPFGGDIVDGLSKGIRENGEAIKEAIIAAVENGEKGLILEFGIKSPARRFIPYGQAFADALALGMEQNGGKFTVAVLNAAKKAAEDLSTFTITEQADLMEWANSQIASIEKDMAGRLNMESLFSSDSYKAGLAEFKTGLISTFDLFTNFSNTFKSIQNSQAAITKAQEEYNKVVQEGTKNLAEQVDLQADLEKLQSKFGAEGVVTGFERLKINQAELRLLQMKSNLNKKDTASERLAIKDAKRELQFLEQAEKRGVATADEVQAARERLAEMTGTTQGIDGFQGRDNFQKMLDLQKDILTEQVNIQTDLFDELKEKATLIAPEITAMEERIADLESQIESQSDAEVAAQQGISDAKMEQFNTQLKLFELADRIIAAGPEGVKQFQKIAAAAGMPEQQIQSIIDTANTMAPTFKSQFDEVATMFDSIFVEREAAKLTIDTTEAMANIKRVQGEVNMIFESFGMELPFPDLRNIQPPSTTPPGSDKGSLLDKVLHTGGFLNVGKRALVGEFGPEIISPSPTGVRVTPTGIGGGSGGGITVNQLSVNVTGVPSDPQSARKAAQSIRKALVNLEKEGNSSSILGR